MTALSGFDGSPIVDGCRVALAAAPSRRGTVRAVYPNGRDPWALVAWDDGRTVSIGTGALERVADLAGDYNGPGTVRRVAQ